AISVVSELNLFNAILIIGVALPTMYMGAKIKLRALKIMYFLLPSFLLLHGLYHLFSFLEALSGNGLFGFLGEMIMEPLGYILLFAFAIYFARRGG
ncbi:MAG: hypothetical protein HYU03_00925, partial [Thaumarchaeota archaeon]|nr:hypothetical protein [Nitrososphaerota archaeon]